MKAKLDKIILSGIILSIFIGVTGYSTGMIYGKSIDEENAKKLANQNIQPIMEDNSKNDKSDAVSDNSKKSDEKKDDKNKSNKNKSASKNTSGRSNSSTPRTNTASTSSPSNTTIPSKLKDGTYYGQANGYAGAVKVKVVVSGGKISDISVVSHSETPGYYEKGAGVISSILSAQNTNVDSVSGATLTSNAIKSAVANALKDAGMSSGSNSGSSSSASSNNEKKYKDEIEKLKKELLNAQSSGGDIDFKKLKDGTYEGSGTGFKSTIKVSVKIENGKLVDISVLSQGDDEEYFNKAKNVIQDMLSKQTIKVDSVSGATFSSSGIKSAVMDALKKAGANIAGNDESETLKKQVAELQQEKENLKNQLNAAINNAADVPTDKLQDGTYEGTGRGFKSTIKVSLKIVGGKIESIDIVEQNDDEPYFSDAKALIPRVIEAQSVKVDSISGATFSSNGIKSAIRDAMKKAGKSMGDDSELRQKIEELTSENSRIKSEKESLKKEFETEKGKFEKLVSDLNKKIEILMNGGKIEEPEKPKNIDGDYEGEAEASKPSDVLSWGEESSYKIKIKVTVKDGKISKLDDENTVISSKHNKRYYGNAKVIFEKYIGKDVSTIIEKDIKDSGVDVISNATVSSNAIHSAIQDALKKIK